MRHRHALVLVPALLALAACGPSSAPVADAGPDAAPPAPEVAPVPPQQTAFAVLQPTEGSQVSGELRFALVDGGVHVSGQVVGLPADSEHGFHVHAIGDCSAPDGTSAGGHFNPGDSEHGRSGHGEHHAGDSDNLRSNADGIAEVDTWLHGASLGDAAATDITGKGVIVHADPDDYVSQPTGNAGDRLACGVIEVP